ncbi:MAG: hypothetical protein WKF58_10865 [Ilumatobacteraceae bacterium]
MAWARVAQHLCVVGLSCQQEEKKIVAAVGVAGLRLQIHAAAPFAGGVTTLMVVPAENNSACLNAWTP